MVRARYSRKVNCSKATGSYCCGGGRGGDLDACPWKLLLALLPHIGVTQYFLLILNRVTFHGV